MSSTDAWRGAVRVLILPAMVGGAVLVTAGGMHEGASLPTQDAFVAGGSLTGTYLTLDASRIEASGDAQWEYTVPAIAVQEVPKPAVARAVVNNPIPPALAGNAVLEEATKYVGTPYLKGGTTPAGFDCSGFVSYIYSQFGVSLPHSSSAYWSIGQQVSSEDALPGDLIVSKGHVAIYAGDNMQIDAPRQGKTIQFREIWQNSYIFVRVV